MFEGSLVESRGLVVSRTQRWTALGSLTLQCAIAGLLIAIPLVRPESMPLTFNTPRLTMPMPVKPPVPVVVQSGAEAATSAALSAPVAAPAGETTRRFVFPQPGATTDGPNVAIDPNLRIGSGAQTAQQILAIAGTGNPNVTVVRARDIGPTRVSQGVSAGMLLTPIRPTYPAIAIAARVQGDVVLEAVISKAGRIESLHVVSGPAMLQSAALTAVQAARYRPYLLSGEPTDVQTTITVAFRLGS
jgi:periplasmic protein TonB